MSAVLAVALSPLSSGIATKIPAHADELSDIEAWVKQSAADYNGAVQRQEELAAEIEELDGRISKIEAELPAQLEHSDESYRALYKYSYDTSSMLGLLLDSQSFTDMLALVDSYDWVIAHNLEQIEKAQTMKRDLEESRSKLESDKAEAEEQAAAAASSLADAKQARENAKQRALEAQRAEEQARKEEAAKKVEEAPTEEEKEEVQQQAQEEEQAEETASSENVDWSSDKSAFVDKWAPRIDAYLDGSPTAGTGKYYAAAAWDNGVDPRWAPAISLVESSRGAACFASCNAWGYGGSGFSSWEEGINTVVGSLGSSLYGGYLTKQAAQTYCPPTWQDWYNKVANEMAQI